MYHPWQDVLVVITVLRCPVHRTRVSLVKRGFLPCHIYIPPWVCAVADILGARFGIVREESGTRPGVDGIHPVPLGPGPRAKHGGGTRDALSMRILRMRTVEQLRRSLGRLVGRRDARACLKSAIRFGPSWPYTWTDCGWLVRSYFLLVCEPRYVHLSSDGSVPRIVSGDAGWRWVFWVNMIFAGSCTVACFFFIPETYGPYILRKKARAY